ncbi:hypothetical protein AVEN_30079-1 [Araneus ventricosus]|uniref:Uncharacterized protein n=1 Tax=Araneus ventricosus TaxID=182803 RepID=A0A4Y2H492_ARAVE|nr:hypothetical protein AVEN_30079-1 [Araneus ventricosus]
MHYRQCAGMDATVSPLILYAAAHTDSGVPCSQTARRFLNAKSLVLELDMRRNCQLGLWFRILLQLSVPSVDEKNGNMYFE